MMMMMMMEDNDNDEEDEDEFSPYISLTASRNCVYATTTKNPYVLEPYGFSVQDP